MSSLLFPDVNVWVALSFDRHSHHSAVKEWYAAVPESATLVFCRQTQLGLFRLLTTASVMGNSVLPQAQCWTIYDRWVGTGQVAWADEPQHLEKHLRALTTQAKSSPKQWTDAYLAAFAECGDLTLVTFDRALAARAKGAVLLA